MLLHSIDRIPDDPGTNESQASSHNLHQVQKISHRVGIMIRGKMVAEGSIEALAREKFGLGEEHYSLEEIYMKYFREV